MAFEQEGAERKRLGRRPIDTFAGFDRFATIFQEALDGPVRVETFRYRRDTLSDLPEHRERGAGVAAAWVIRIARRLNVGPTAVEPIGAVRLVTLARFELGIELGAPIDAHLLDLTRGDDVLADQLLGIDLGNGGMLADRLGHQRLSEWRRARPGLAETP